MRSDILMPNASVMRYHVSTEPFDCPFSTEIKVRRLTPVFSASASYDIPDSLRRRRNSDLSASKLGARVGRKGGHSFSQPRQPVCCSTGTCTTCSSSRSRVGLSELVKVGESASGHKPCSRMNTRILRCAWVHDSSLSGERSLLGGISRPSSCTRAVLRVRGDYVPGRNPGAIEATIA